MSSGSSSRSTVSATPPPDIVAGLIERVTFHSAESGFCVLRVKARGHRELVTVVGHAAMVSAGEAVTASGAWVNDASHGLQLRARTLRTSEPTSAEGIERYLGSGLVPGIGPVYARRLVASFGTGVFDVIEASPERLREVTGIGPRRASRITAAWADQKVIREIMVFLHAHGVGTARAVRIFRAYGGSAIEVMTENPYRLAREIRGIGFKTADVIASRLGIAPTAMIRVRAGLSFALSEATGQGHCGLPVDELLTLAERLLSVPRPLIEAAALEVAEGTVVASTIGEAPCLFLAGLFHAERGIAERLARLQAEPLPWPAIDAERALPWVEARTGLTLAPSQAQAVRLALASKVLVITGGPGVGKTTLVRAILRILQAKAVGLALCAPTGRAAKRLSETTGLPATTIHRLLETDPATGGFKHGEMNPLTCELLVVDESSMVDVPLMHALLKALPATAALLLVGDVDQLPSVGPGQVLADLIASEAVPVVRLTEVFRQAAESRIVASAHKINRGEVPDLGRAEAGADFVFVPAETPEEAVARILTLVTTRIPRRFRLNPVRDVQVLCPMNRGGVGARALNVALQAALNPGAGVRAGGVGASGTGAEGAEDEKEGEAGGAAAGWERGQEHRAGAGSSLAGGGTLPRVERYGHVFAPGDKVMQVENDPVREVFNGDLGLVEQVDLEAGELVALFDGRRVTYPFADLDALQPAYAVTIHKSQGSEYPAVVIPVLTQHYPMLQRSLLYTGVTRGKRLVVLVGQRRAVAMAVKSTAGRQRWTRLREWMGEGR